MNTTTLFVTGSTQSLSGDIYYDEITLKGRTNVLFNFVDLESFNNNILRAKINYGDGRESKILSYSVGFDHISQPITYYFALYGGYSPLLVDNHIYDPPKGDTYFKSMTASFALELADTSLITFFFPIKIAQPSYYEEIGNFDIADTQLISSPDNDIFCAIYDKTGDVSNIVLS